LDEVRHSLIEVQEAEEKKPKWWQRFGKGSRKSKTETGMPAPVETVVESEEPEAVNMPVEPPVVDSVKKDEYVEQLDELIDMLEEEAHTDVLDEEVSATHVDEATPEEKQKEQEIVDIKELKKRAFSARAAPEMEDRSLSEVRSVALDEGEEVFVEVEAKAEDQMQDRMKAIENALRPYRRYFYFVFVFISLVMVLVVSASLYRLYLRSLPPPQWRRWRFNHPVSMNLPGGLSFRLGKETREGRWNRRPNGSRGPKFAAGSRSRQPPVGGCNLAPTRRIKLNRSRVITIYWF
jgi:hypothetical protein